MADDELTQAVLRYTGTTHQRTGGITATPVHGLYLVRRTAPSALEHAVEQPPGVPGAAGLQAGRHG